MSLTDDPRPSSVSQLSIRLKIISRRRSDTSAVMLGCLPPLVTGAGRLLEPHMVGDRSGSGRSTSATRRRCQRRTVAGG
jgi:hypothetical protein